MTTQLVMAFTLARWFSLMKWPRYRYSVEVNACARLQEAAPESTQAHVQEGSTLTFGWPVHPVRLFVNPVTIRLDMPLDFRVM